MSTSADVIPTAARVEALVIGAGPAGLAVGACLRRANVSFRIFDAGDRVGRSWQSRFDRLHLLSVKRYSALPFMPFPSSVARYPSRQQVIAYLESYADHFNLHPSFRQPVTSARLQDGEWWTQTPTGTCSSRYLIVCTGYNRIPIIPKWGGEECFDGSIIHSSEYRRAEPFRGKRVLVIGMGNSGSEIALDLCEHGADTSIAVRGPVNIVPRDPLGIPIQILSILSRPAKPEAIDALMRPIWRLLVGDLRSFGLPLPPHGPAVSSVAMGRIPVLDIGMVQHVKAGRIRVRGDVARFTSDGVVFADGRHEAFDAVMLATGFRPELDSFLPDVSEVTDARGYPMMHGQRTAISGLYFCGFHNVSTGLLREIGREAKRIGRDIAEEAGC